MSMVAVVLVNPPTAVQENQEVDEEEDDFVLAARLEYLAVAGVVA